MTTPLSGKTAVDFAPANHNGMAGVRCLKQCLNSQILVFETDLDNQSTLLKRHFSLAVFPGIIYHLKNPFPILEVLSRQHNHMVLSTRATNSVTGLPAPRNDIPLAHLLEEQELNAGDSNFTEAAVSRRQFLAGLNRLFVLARSTFAPANLELESGWHAVEGRGWRWTERRFSAWIPGPFEGNRLPLRLDAPPELFSGTPAVLSVRVNGAPLEPENFTRPGNYVYTRLLPDGLALEARFPVEFELDRAVPREFSDRRELALIVPSLEVV